MTCKKHEISANYNMGRILIATRAGDISWPELVERFGAQSCVSLWAGRLIRMGYITKVASEPAIYRITPAGRAACPTRRQPRREAVCA